MLAPSALPGTACWTGLSLSPMGLFSILRNFGRIFSGTLGIQDGPGAQGEKGLP